MSEAAERAARMAEEKLSPPNSETAQSLPRLKTAKEFVANFIPPDWLIDGILQRGYFYPLTAKTGHGKTVVALLAGVLHGSWPQAR